MKTTYPLFAAVLLAACADMPATTTRTEQNVTKIETGQTREDVLKILGKPEQQTTFDRLREGVWGYRYMDTRHMLVSAHFSTDSGQVKNVTHIMDPSGYGTNGAGTSN